MPVRRPGQLACIVSLAVAVSNAEAAVEKARLARTMWSAVQCGTYAEMLDNGKEQSRLFELAVKAGREFLDAFENGQIPPEVVNTEVPVGVAWLLQGPNTDFIIGRIFENAIRDAYDGIGRGIDDKELRKSRAQTKYLQGNCDLLK